MIHTIKLIVIDPDTDSKLGAIASAAHKTTGLEMLSDVNTLINSIIEEPLEEKAAEDVRMPKH